MNILVVGKIGYLKADLMQYKREQLDWCDRQGRCWDD